MNCPKCNAPLGANDAFCLNCGEKVAQQPQYAAYNNPSAYAPAGAPAAAAPVKKASPLNAVAGLFKSKDGKPSKLVPIIAIVVVALVVLIIVSSILGSPKSVAKRYLKADYEGDIYTMLKYTYIDNSELKDLMKQAAKEEDLSEKELYSDLCAEYNDTHEDANADFDDYKGYIKFRSENSKETKHENREETFGSDYKIKVDIEDVETCTKSQTEEYRDELDDVIRGMEENGAELSFDSDDAKKFKEVDYVVTIEGSEDTEEYEDTLVLVKIKGDWKVMSDDALYGLMF